MHTTGRLLRRKMLPPDLLVRDLKVMLCKIIFLFAKIMILLFNLFPLKSLNSVERLCEEKFGNLGYVLAFAVISE